MMIFLSQTGWPAALVLIVMILAITVLICFLRTASDEAGRIARQDYLEHRSKQQPMIEGRPTPPDNFNQEV
jgi:hypothetical protein